jgi:DNA polymerase III sliding clamp (beta) subunit (PCNA family)
VKITTESDALDTAVRSVLRTAGISGEAGILIETRGDQVLVQAASSAAVIDVLVPAVVETIGRLVIPGRLFSSVIAKGSGSLSLHSDATLATIITGGVTSSLRVLDDQAVPSFGPIPVPEILVSASHLAEAVSAVAPAVSTDPNRAQYCGIYLEVVDSSVHVTATDTYRLVTDVRPGPDGSLTAIVPPSAFTPFLKATEGEIGLVLSGSDLILSYEDTTVRARLLAGEYPKYRDLLAVLGTEKIVVSTSDLLTLLAAVAPTAPSQRTVTLTMSPTSLQATTKSEMGESHGDIVLENAHDLTLSLNLDFLVAALKIMGDQATFTHGDDLRRPVMVSSAVPTRCLLMPLRTT